jgi:hypothetical protein
MRRMSQVCWFDQSSVKKITRFFSDRKATATEEYPAPHARRKAYGIFVQKAHLLLGRGARQYIQCIHLTLKD